MPKSKSQKAGNKTLRSAFLSGMALLVNPYQSEEVPEWPHISTPRETTNKAWERVGNHMKVAMQDASEHLVVK